MKFKKKIGLGAVISDAVKLDFFWSCHTTTEPMILAL